MADSLHQVGAGNRTSIFGTVDYGALLSVIHELVAAIPDLDPDDADRREANAEPATVQDQMGLSKTGFYR